MNLSDFYRDKRVLITGGTGFKGSWICQSLLFLGADVYGIGLEPNTSPALFNLLKLQEKMRVKIFDIRDYSLLKEVFDSFQPEIVIHLAAQPLVIDSFNDPRYTYDVNVMGTVNVCECVRQTSSVKSFINVTTDKVYENVEKENYQYLETDRLNGFDPYSNSKSCSELVTQSYMKCFFQNKDIAVSTCRAGNVIGGGDFSKNRILPDCVNYTIHHEPIELRNPNSVRPYQHVLEADMFYLQLAMMQEENHDLSGHYNIGPNDSDCITTGKLCKLFCEAWGEGASYHVMDYNGPHEAKFLRLNTGKAREKLQWQPRWTVRTAVNKTVDWSKAWADMKDLTEVTNKQIREYLEESYGK